MEWEGREELGQGVEWKEGRKGGGARKERGGKGEGVKNEGE